MITDSEPTLLSMRHGSQFYTGENEIAERLSSAGDSPLVSRLCDQNNVVSRCVKMVSSESFTAGNKATSVFQIKVECIQL